MSRCSYTRRSDVHEQRLERGIVLLKACADRTSSERRKRLVTCGRGGIRRTVAMPFGPWAKA